jgi:hypothetical protein
MFRIDDHVGIAIAGLTSDARVLRFVTPDFFLCELAGELRHKRFLVYACVQQLYASAGHGVQDGL